MSCPMCGFRFYFKEPFHEFNRFQCPRCDNEVDIPDQIIEQFLDNIDFMEFIKKRNPPKGKGDTNSPPPYFT